ncbi:MAG: hypothetical protein J6C28_04450 [Bacilli bacterium]|nr:hypothetical protein [Bacilli bacterium]
MKKIILIILIVLELSIIKIPSYKELNNLAIIEEIKVIKENNKYTITLKEIIPIKENDGINYKYKYYKESSNSITDTINKLNNQTKKKLYLKKAKSLTTNIINSNNIIKELDIKPKIINHINY